MGARLAALSAHWTGARAAGAASFPTVDEQIRELLKRPDVIAARDWMEQHDADTLASQRAIAEIPAPTFDEARRAGWVAARFRDIGLTDVRTDEAGNVLARLGAGNGGGVMVCSHLDTVFPAGTPVAVKTAGRRLSAPGIGDNARGLAALLTLAEACLRCHVRVPHPVTFVASVGEEGQGDLRGAKHLFSAAALQHFSPSAFIALDGPGMDRLVHRALGSRRLRATYRGPGGHSWSAFGVPNPAHAVGIATAQLAEIALPGSPRVALSVVRLGGGTSLNTIPTEAWLELDLRAESAVTLAGIGQRVDEALQKALELVNRKRASGTVALSLELTALGERPGGETAPDHPLVQAALAATRALGGNPTLAAASTDANIAISRGIPGIALGAGGRGGDAHLPTEWYENENGPAGIVRALLVLLALQGTGA